ncbi:hypothetical protein MD535_10580 [Vibrio sp. ZSDZ65]|uniref:Fimbrial protein n=1 Tax=Vibrio qingdaonensis TaxID=2829491 RepID=A0A9X3HWI9_9VIBR|nr:hypothetical protein [Vibrio qingdaonensis]MCW8346446.1 hypothetical protein [Vibrio qingdaonensis]
MKLIFKFIIFFTLVFLPKVTYALPWGVCSVSGYSSNFVGKGIPIGDAEVGEIIGQINVSFNWRCRPHSGNTARLFIVQMNTSLKSGNTFYSNIPNIELETPLTVETQIGGQENTIVFVETQSGPVEDSYIASGVVNTTMFNVRKVGEVNESVQSEFLTTSYIMDLNYSEFYSAVGNFVVRSFAKTPVSFYNASCHLNYNPAQSIPTITEGKALKVTHDFDINLSCVSPISMQNNVSWTFNVEGDNVSIPEGNAIAVHAGDGVPTVLMALHNMKGGGSGILFKHRYDFPTDGIQSSFTFPLRSEFEWIGSGPVGAYSFKLNFQVDYN